MAISDKINSIKTHIGNAYTAIEEKGGMIPPNKNCENLKTAIESISAGSELNIVYGANLPESSQIKEIKTLTATLPLPTAALGITNMGCAAVGTKVYLFGGYAAGRVNTIQEFDAETKTISTLSTTLPYAANSITCVSVGSKIYIFGGYNGNYLNKILEFDTILKTLVTLSTSLPNGMRSMGGAAVGTKIYLFGGNGLGSPKSIQEFDAETKTITTLSETLPVALDGMGCAAVGSKIYLFGGHSAGRVNTIQEFDAETKTITTLSETLPVALADMGCASIGSKIYIFGGLATSGINAIQEFDTETKTIAMLSEILPEISFNMGCAAVGSNVYLFGGGVNGGSTNAIREIDITVPNTSKLWIKSTEPDEITVSCNPEQQVEGFNTDTGITGITLPTSGPKIAIGTKIYVIGGYNSTAILEIDTVAKTIVTLNAVLPVNMGNNGGAAAIGNDIYIFYHPKTATATHANYVYKLNTISKELTTIRNETGQSGGYYEYYNAIPYGTDIYLHVKSASDTSDGGKIEKYNTLTDSYSLVLSGSSITSWGWAATTIIGDVIYIFGGGNSNSSGSNTIAKFNISTGEYTVLESTLPVIDYKLTAIAIGTKVYLFGGQTHQSVILFDSITETATLLSSTLPMTMRQNCGAAIGNTIWLAYTDTCQYIVNFPLSNNDILIQQSYNKNIVDILSAPTRVQIGVKNVYKGNSSNEAEFVDAYLFNGENAWENVNTGDLVLAKYFAPTISLTGSTLTITPNSKNPSGVSYQIYNSLSPVAIVTDTTVDLAALITYVYGTHSISVKTIGTTSKDSNQSNAIDLKLYSITASLTNVTSASDNAERMAAGDTKTLTFTAAEGFEFPDTVEVSGATGVWTKSTGTLVLSNATGNITFTIAAMSASGHTVTISMREQGAYATYANVYVDDGTSAVKYTADSPVTVKANSKIYIDAAADSFAVGWDGTFNATVTGGVTLTASTDSTATFAVTGDGTIVTNGITD